MIDWDRFARRVRVGTRVQGNCSIAMQFRDGPHDDWYSPEKKEGILIRHYREIWNWTFLKIVDEIVIQFEDSLRERSIPPEYLLYLIDGRWLSYTQLMGDGE